MVSLEVSLSIFVLKTANLMRKLPAHALFGVKNMTKIKI